MHHMDLLALDLAKTNLVVMTYEVLRYEYQSTVATKEDHLRGHRTAYTNRRFPLLSIKWNLVVLEESHRIVNPKAMITQAATELQSHYRMVVTGTLHHGSSVHLPLGLGQHLYGSSTIRITTDGTFAGKPVSAFPLRIKRRQYHILPSKERIPQDLVKEQWDPSTKKQAEGTGLLTDRNIILKLISEARLGLVHIACIEAGHSPRADGDKVNEEDTDSSENGDDIEAYEIESPHPRGKEHCPKSPRKKRMEFMDKMEKSWDSTPIRISVADIEEFHDAQPDNKAIIFSEFLTHLDVVQVALRSIGINVLQFDARLHEKSARKYQIDFKAPRIRTLG
ncbi:hypothetical protein DM02DRAFT_621674 [Periconia macrospinosa]|uniref:SNF2 N-terminal domain-containing protein n=1 Tax=Periconia macrospinosa TaxID=97972 RepID=A0A2V1EEK7_9PLEO|nr:hypothetical protein DM02DRAFT_621674 [Periconia macrospinosa]